ncbi:solute carrier family 23 member 1 [Trichonephila clavipes]|nr:solute carrier family 23 member 1 [Trichonephila clavipes]
MTGMVGFLLNWITPLAIVPTISLVGLSLFAEASHSASGHWGIAMFTMILMVIFSQCLKDFTIPHPKYSSKTGWATGRFDEQKLEFFIIEDFNCLKKNYRNVVQVSCQVRRKKSNQMDCLIDLFEKQKDFVFTKHSQ